MIIIQGFDSSPLCIIWWESNGMAISRTVCYSEEDKRTAIERFNTNGDFYNKTYESYFVDYGEEAVC